MKLTEVAAEYSNPYYPEEDIGLLTLGEFLYSRNPLGKSHPSDVYDTTIESLNRSWPTMTKDISYVSRSYDKLYITQYENGGTIISTESSGRSGSKLDENTVLAVVIDDTVYYTVRFSKSIFPLHFTDYNGNKIDIVPTKFEKVKYISEYLDKVKLDSSKNIKNYPYVIRRMIIADEALTIRTDSKDYPKDSGHSIVITNERNQVVATATDEWGATLLRVAKEYRGKNLGRILGDLWYSKNPGYTSGGFSPQGKHNAKKIWSERVRTMLQNGWYSDLIRNKRISPEKIKEILSSLLPRERTPVAQPKSDQEPLLYSDGSSVFVVYDKKFYEDQDDKYIYAFGLIRDFGGKVFAYTLDYNSAYRRLATYILIETVQLHGDKLYVADKPSDHIDLSGITDVVVDDEGYATLESPKVNVMAYVSQERRYRIPRDKHGEILQLLLEQAHSKWL